jgi:hypothetical protein
LGSPWLRMHAAHSVSSWLGFPVAVVLLGLLFPVVRVLVVPRFATDGGFEPPPQPAASRANPATPRPTRHLLPRPK